MNFGNYGEIPEYQQCPKETQNILNLTEQKLKIMHKDGILCRTDYEVLELQKNTCKQHGHGKAYDFETGLRNSAECLPSL